MPPISAETKDDFAYKVAIVYSTLASMIDYVDEPS